MCGIVGFTGEKPCAVSVLMEGLCNLEYRGYDSAGISYFDSQGTLTTVKTQGRLDRLQAKLDQIQPQSCCGIGHTRWATHGEPSDQNAHPHFTEKVSLVHNGIIENYQELRQFLAEKGYSFSTETDTETAVKLIDYFYQGDPFQALRKAAQWIEGSYAFGVLFADFPGHIYAMRKDSPLIVAVSDEGNFIASDISAVLRHTRRYHLLSEGEIALVMPDRVTFFTIEMDPIEKEVHTADWNIEQAQKGGYPHFMLKEIFEQPEALQATISPRLSHGLPDFSVNGLENGFFREVDSIHIVACGTAMHAGMVGKTLLEKLARVPVEVEVASEFRYRDPIFSTHPLVIVISQSGETADTLAALRLCKRSGVPVLAVVNVTGSSIAREADYCLYTYAGPEIAVASTKAYSVQIALMYLLAARCALDKGKMTEEEGQQFVKQLQEAAAATADVLALSDRIAVYAQELVPIHDLFFVGRGIDYALALEGSLKLKEISYIHSEAYAAGELKHGPISLISEGVPVIALATQPALLAKTVSNIKEIKARGGQVLLITREDAPVDPSCCDSLISLPNLDPLFMPLAAVVVLQLVAYHAAVGRGCDVDKPRNLAKSVTVE